MRANIVAIRKRNKSVDFMDNGRWNVKNLMVTPSLEVLIKYAAEKLKIPIWLENPAS